jgi:hypothetical protein
MDHSTAAAARGGGRGETTLLSVHSHFPFTEIFSTFPAIIPFGLLFGSTLYAQHEP